ncbi:hypothetical protein FE251_09570 [Georgenia wutianyii]|uniref:Exonuclease domain-containing protein n=1 Tax=Georgenia wutianyii TaxID=2585135 RepID=A0ABX5VN04_9MICO|nr:exonuclease domain-containing protein [Georgenia wutianyii]QDB79593.1 hypothetical protein FE251_09570 [Georgenia wutianyii]
MELFIGLAVIALALLLFRPRRPAKPTRRRPEAAPAPAPAPVTVTPRPKADSSSRVPFAEPGRVGPLFSYAELGRKGGIRHDGPFAVIDVETTGFSPRNGDRVIEIAIARVDASGRIEDEYSTLLNPEGRDTGAVFIHQITNEMVRNAPLFGDVAGEILSRLDGAVVVAHNAAFEERFLAAELSRVGARTSTMPALCSLWLGKQTFNTPNYKLATLAEHAGIAMPDAHAALGDVRAVAGLLNRMMDRHAGSLTYPCAPGRDLRGPFPVGGCRPVTRAVSLRKGQDGWMSSLLARLPMSTQELDDAAAAAYLEVLGEALADGKIIGDEARALARIAGSAGMGAAQVAALNERFLELMREVALSDGVLTTTELRQLNRAADALSVSDYFDDLVPTSAPAAVSGAPVATVTATRTPAVRRCGHCRTPGHYRTRCPEVN